MDIQVPIQVLDRCSIPRGGHTVDQVWVHWSGYDVVLDTCPPGRMRLLCASVFRSSRLGTTGFSWREDCQHSPEVVHREAEANGKYY
jgi:hypothetical protein